jgi:pSer/pThr/pTyr-binding forkhead associated (FHA) protein
MKSNYTLGRSPENDIVIEDPCIGRKHLYILFRSDKELLIEDLESSNHTFVNDIRIKKKLISQDDIIRLGTYLLDTSTLFSEIIKKVNESRTDFSVEFNALKKVYEDYEKKVNEFKSKSQLWPMFIKAFFTLCAMASAYLLISDPQIRYPAMTGAGLIGGIISIAMQRDSKLKDQIDILTADLEMVYKCPKCGKSLISRRWQHWAAKKECENCGAKWVI